MGMKLNLEQVSGILGKSNDEVMFLVQSKKLTAGVEPDSLSWSFDLDNVLSLKIQLDEEVNPPQLLME